MTALATELNRTAKVEMRVGMRIILTEFATGAAAAAVRTGICSSVRYYAAVAGEWLVAWDSSRVFYE